MSNETEIPRERALRKLRAELAKGIDLMRSIGRQAGILEVGYLLHLLHLTRLFGATPEEAVGLRAEFVKTGMALTEDTVKYAVQMCLKHGSGGFAVHPKRNVPVLRLDLITGLLRVGDELNSKYDLQSPLTLLDVTVSGDRDQIVQLDLSRLNADPETKRLFDYFLRLDLNSLSTGPKTHDVLIAKLHRDFQPYANLFQQEFGVSIETYFRLVEFLLKRVQERIRKAEPRLPQVSAGRVDVLSREAFLVFFDAISIRREEIFSEFGTDIEVILQRLTFRPDGFDETELRYNAITRAPLIGTGGQRILASPELLLDSLRINTHYTLLEGAKRVSEQYKARASDEFLTQIASVASPHGFVEVGRNTPVKDGKIDLGDLDLVLRNEAGEFLIIEAKNHALPLNVYFRDASAVRAHLLRLRAEWEQKVQKREEYLLRNPGACNVSGPFKHVIVSRDPEVLSHFSSLLAVSIKEFEFWLPRRTEVTTFPDLHRILYENQEQFTEAEMNILIKDGIFPDFETSS